jgi:hypothetical protein
VHWDATEQVVYTVYKIVQLSGVGALFLTCIILVLQNAL